MKKTKSSSIKQQHCEHYLIEMQDILEEQIDNLMHENMNHAVRIETNILTVEMLTEKLEDIRRQLAEGEND